jgi:hypothetical protein
VREDFENLEISKKWWVLKLVGKILFFQIVFHQNRFPSIDFLFKLFFPSSFYFFYFLFWEKFTDVLQAFCIFGAGISSCVVHK